MASTFTTFDAALREYYLPPARNQLNNEAFLLSLLKKTAKHVEGRRAVLSLKVRRNAGIGARADGGTLPTAGNTAWAEERVSVYHLYGRLEVTGPAIRAMGSDKGSFVRPIKAEMQDLTDGLAVDTNRQLWGTSDGVIATATTSSTGQAVLSLATTTTEVQMREFEEGMPVDVGTLAELASGTGGPTYGNAIVSVDVSAKTLTLTSNLSTAADGSDFVSRAGNGGSGANQKELTGLQTIVDSTGTLHNVNPSTYSVWKSTENSNSGTNRSVSENLFASVMHDVRIASGADIDKIITSDGVFRAYANLLTSQKRFPNTLDLKGGYKGLDFSAGGYGGGQGVAICWDRFAPANQAFLLNTAHLTIHQQSDWDWLDMDGSVLSRVANKDSWEATLAMDAELATDARNRHGKIVDLTEAA